MKTADLLKNLSYGEFSNLSISNDGDGSIRETDIPKILMHVNSGLVALFSRFILLEKELTLNTMDEVAVYFLREEFAMQSTKPAPYKYIDDTFREPFTEDLVKVLDVYDDAGCEVPLNRINDCRSIFTTQHDSIQVNNPSDYKTLFLVYQARHPVLTDTEQEIEIPYFLEEALQAYVAGRFYSNMNGQEHLMKSQEQMARYESICVEALNNGLVQTQRDNLDTKMQMRGWV